MQITDLPDVRFTNAGNPRQSQPLTLLNLKKILEHMDMTVRWDMAKADVDLFYQGSRVAPSEVGYTIESLCDNCLRLDIGNITRVPQLLKEIALQDPFHPMEDWLKSLPLVSTDQDPIADLAASIKTDNPLWPVYLENWLIQCVQGVCGWHDQQTASLPYCLVLVGGQGLGKTEWLRRLGGSWIKSEAELHLSSPSGKDHQIEALKFPLVELSELDGIFRKADVSHMKSFISRETDAIRAPYDRRAVIKPRMTSFCGSVNTAEFLTDSSGSRRFWPVEVEDIDWDYQIDHEALWSVAYELWQSDPYFDLTAEQNEQREQISVEVHTALSPEAEKIQEFYRRHAGNPKYKERVMNRTEILEMLYGKNRVFSPKTVAEAGLIINKLLGKARTIDGKQRAWEFPFNEFGVDPHMWPDKNHLTLVKPDSPET